jgi:hypothetical protein
MTGLRKAAGYMRKEYGEPQRRDRKKALLCTEKIKIQSWMTSFSGTCVCLVTKGRQPIKFT